MRRFTISVVVVTGFCLLAFSGNDQTSPFDVSYTRSAIQWSIFVPSSGSVLTVSGPGGYYLRQEYGEEYGANSRPQFGALDEQEMRRAEGLYRWELVAQLPPGPGGEVPDEPNPVVSGSFVISGGMIIPQPDDAQPATVEEGAPVRSLFLDREGRLGLGTTVPQSQLHLKGNSPAFTLEDTTSGGRAFTLRGLEKGDGSLGLFDQAGKVRWLIDSEGRIGINTTKPTSSLTVDGYIETTKGFLVDGKPIGGIGLGLIGGTQPLSAEGDSNNYFGTGAGGTAGGNNSFFGAYAGDVNGGSFNNMVGSYAGKSNSSGNYNNFFGANAGQANTTGVGNSFFGDLAGQYNVTGSNNSIFGREAGWQNNASNNSFFGAYAGHANTTAIDNSFFGFEAGRLNQTGVSNSFFGRSTGYSNTGSYNTFVGFEAGYSNTFSPSNSFFGDRAGRASTGSENSIFGSSAGIRNTAGYQNSFFGASTALYNTTGNDNCFFGAYAGSSNTIESHNTFIGAGSNGAGGITNATALGSWAKVTASNSLVLGSIGGTNPPTSYVNVGIGTTSPAYALHVVRTGMNSAVVADRTDGAANYMNATATFGNFGTVNNYPLRLMVNGTWRMRLDSDNSLSMVNGAGCTAGGDWYNASSRDYKEDIEALSGEEATAAVEALNPVKFTYKADKTERKVGFIAEEVPDLVATKDRKSLSPMDIVAVLTRVVQEQQAELDSLKAKVAGLEALLQPR